MSESIPYPCFRRSLRYAEYDAHLSIGQSMKVGEKEGLLFQSRELFKAVRILIPSSPSLGSVGIAVLSHLVIFAARGSPCPNHLLVANYINCLVPRYISQKRLQTSSLGVVTFRLSPQHHEGVLRNFIRKRGVSQDP
jgi:hypothetical protein